MNRYISSKLLPGMFFHKLPHDSGPFNESFTIMTKGVVMPILPSAGDHFSSANAACVDPVLLYTALNTLETLNVWSTELTHRHS